MKKVYVARVLEPSPHPFYGDDAYNLPYIGDHGTTYLASAKRFSSLDEMAQFLAERYGNEALFQIEEYYTL